MGVLEAVIPILWTCDTLFIYCIVISIVVLPVPVL